MLIDIPRFKCWVDSYFLTNGEKSGLKIEAYCFAVTLIESRPLLWTIHTVDGAVYSRLPIYALQTIKDAHAGDKTLFIKNPLDVWGAISSHGQVIKHKYLKDYEVHVNFTDKVVKGTYQFTIDYFEDGFSEDPEQHKTSNIIFLDSGYVCVVPNNYCLFKDKHFTHPIEVKPQIEYKRQLTYHKV